MNITHVARRGVTARIYALLTIASMILSAFPAAFFVAEAAGTLVGPDSDNNVSAGSPYESAVVDASAFENLVFSFDYDSQTLDGDTPDSFTYGWRSGAVDHDLGTINGLAGNDAAEIDSVLVGLPVGAQASDLQVYVTVSANSASDKVKLSNITVTGNYAGDLPIGVLNDEDTPFTNSDGNVKFCHYTNENASHDYNYLSVNISSFFGGHDEDTEDIVPPFFYVDGNVLKLFPGINWDDDGMAIYRNDCVAPVVPVDVCPNLDGDQAEVPDGFYVDQSGDCVEDDPQGPDYLDNTCFLPDGEYEDFTRGPIIYPNEDTLEEIFATAGYGAVNVDDEQLSSEVWDVASLETDTVDLRFTVLGKEAGNKQAFGYYEAGDDSSFVPVLQVGAHSAGVTGLAVGGSVEVTVPAGMLGFALDTEGNPDGLWFSEYDLNADDQDNLAVYNPEENVYLLAFEDRPDTHAQYDNDHNDLVVKMEVLGCDTYGCMDPEADNYDPDATEPGDVQCEYPPVRCENILINGSFEDDEVTSGSLWQKFASVTGWLVEKVSDNTAATLELHEGWSGNAAAEGDQYAELDGDEPTRISQTVTTIPGALYELKWAFAPRQSTAAVENELGVEIDGAQVTTTGPAAGIGVLDAEDWTLDNHVFTADSASTEISFLDLGPEAAGNGADVGTFLDDVQLCLIREPEPEVYTCDAGMLFLDTETDNPETMSLYTVDETDGSATFWAEYDLDLHSAMAVAADGTVYSIEEGTGNLVTLDDDMGAYTVIGNTGLDAGKPVAMEIAPDGTLYVMTQNSDNLYEVDVTDGSATLLSNLDLNVDGGDIVFDGGYIYYIKNTGQVYEIDPDNAYAESLVGTLAVGAKRITSAASKDGTHYAFTRQDSFHAFTLDPFVEGAVELATGPFAFGDGSYCPAEEQRPEGKIKVFKWVNNQDPEDVPFEDFSFQIDEMDPISFNQWGFGYDYVPVGEEYEVNEADIPEGYEHVVTVCKVIEKPNFLYKDTIKVLEQEEMPLEISSFKDALPHQILPDNTVYLEDEHDLGICLVVNERDYDVPPPMCSLDIVSDTGTVVVENSAFAVLTYDNHSAWTADIGDDSDAEWVWENYEVLDPEATTTLTFKETFEVIGGTNALLEVAADNSYKAWLNGHLVIDESDESNNFNNLTQDDEDVTSYLVDGTNTLLIEVTNHPVDGANYAQNPAGVLYRLTLDGDEDSCAITTTPEQEPEMYRIDGFKYEVDGEIAAPALGWVINLLDGEGDPLYSTTTASDGSYYFDVPAGAYQISETLQTDWVQVEVRQDGVVVETDADLERCDFTVPDESDYDCDFYNEYVGGGDPDGDGDGDGDDGPQIYSSGTRIDRPTPQVLGESVTNLCPYLEDYMQIGWDNDTWEVTKLQMFLNMFRDMFGGSENPVTGVFDRTTDANVKAFQAYFQSEVLDPWFTRGIVPHNQPTGFVYKTTLWKINDIVCPEYAVLPDYTGENLLTNIDIDR